MLRALLIILVAFTAACDRRPAPPAAGGSPRIVPLSPAVAIILNDLGLADSIVGRHGHDMVLPTDLPVCGDQTGPDYENLLRVRPTHVLMQWGARQQPTRLAELAGRHHWVVRDYRLLTLGDIRETTADLASLFGAGARGRELAARMDAAWSPRPGAGRAGRVLLLGSVDPPAALGPGSFHHQVLESVGATPAITEGSPYITLDLEDILRLAPDAIILIAWRAPGAPAQNPGAEQVRDALGRIATLDIPAAKSNRLAVIRHPLALTPSTAMIDLADEMAGILSNWSP